MARGPKRLQKAYRNLFGTNLMGFKSICASRCAKSLPSTSLMHRYCCREDCLAETSKTGNNKKQHSSYNSTNTFDLFDIQNMMEMSQIRLTWGKHANHMFHNAPVISRWLNLLLGVRLGLAPGRLALDQSRRAAARAPSCLARISTRTARRGCPRGYVRLSIFSSALS